MERELWRREPVELAAAIRSRKVSSREAVRSVLGRLDAVNPVINAVTVLLADQALAPPPPTRWSSGERRWARSTACPSPSRRTSTRKVRPPRTAW